MSSPGLDRPLKTRRDFERNIGSMIRIKICDSDGVRTLTGRLEKVENEEIIVAVTHGLERININDINKAKLQIEM